MNVLKISWKNIIYRPLSSGLSLLLLASGITIILITLLTSRQISDKFKNNSGGVDLVIAAEGSRLQSVLCNLYQIDKPTGNINYARTGFARMHPMVEKAIPISIGDNYKTYRILATTHDYLSLYGGEIQEGKLWQTPLEATIGSEVATKFKLKVGDNFAGGHGLGESIEEHKDQQYTVVGILKKSNTVLDNLLLTSLESVWILHAGHDHDSGGSFDIISKEEHDANLAKKEAIHEHEEHNHEHHHDHESTNPKDYEAILKGIDFKTREITAMLIQYKTTRARFTLPGIANNTDGMMAAEPAIEIRQLFELIEPAISIISLMAMVIVIIAAISMFIAMLNSLKDRQYEIAIMRTMGASTTKVFTMILLEGLLLAILGYLLGIGISHLGMELFSGYLAETYHYDFTGWIWLKEEWYILAGAIVIGIISALYPAIKAYRTDISKTLSNK
jgi:putative ABC transport system permease protein